MTNILYIGLIMYVLSVTCAPLGENSPGNVICSDIPQIVLEEILGGAYNSRYMSVYKPNEDSENSNKRTVDVASGFYDDSQQDSEEFGDTPAWEVKSHVRSNRDVSGYHRFKRAGEYKQEWHCQSRIRWTDLGPDYFPRYLRSVECVTENCWFNIYKCKPRSFTVKILKRKRDRCVVAQPGTKVGVTGLPRDLKVLWVWEERHVNFCCTCSL